MSTNADQPLFTDPAYVNGQLLAMQAMYVALAKCTPDLALLIGEAGRQLELLRTATLPSGMPDTFFLGIDQVEALLQRLTGGSDF